VSRRERPPDFRINGDAEAPIDGRLPLRRFAIGASVGTGGQPPLILSGARWWRQITARPVSQQALSPSPQADRRFHNGVIR